MFRRPAPINHLDIRKEEPGTTTTAPREAPNRTVRATLPGGGTPIAAIANSFVAGACAYHAGDPCRPPAALVGEAERRWRLGWQRARVDDLSRGGKPRTATRA